MGNITLFRSIILLVVFSSPTLWAIDIPKGIVFNKADLSTSDNEKLPHNIGIQGYSPISYFKKNKAEMGLAKFHAKYKKKIYWFASAEQVNTFSANPEKYIPIFEEFCPYALALGRKIGIDPTNFKIVAEQLLLFHRTSEVDSLKAFNESADQDEILRRAKKHYFSLDF